jgi:hypothetical protein
MIRRVLAAIVVLGLGALAYLGACELALRMLGGAKPELTPAHRQLLDEEAW